MDSNSFIQLTTLNFPEKYQFRLRKSDNAVQIFCPLRKKWFINTPEEWVRQHCIHFLHNTYNYPLSTLVAEYPVTINGLNQRADIIVLKNAEPHILVECKRPSISLDQNSLDQALRYAEVINTTYLFLTNGMQHLLGKKDMKNETITWLNELPSYS